MKKKDTRHLWVFKPFLFINSQFSMSNLFKKVTSTVSVVAVIASAMGSTLVASAANTFTPYADALATAGIISKQANEAGYNLGNNVTRAEMAKVAVNIKKADVKECTGKVFSDVSATLGDLCGYVEAAANAGLVNKTAAKFRPMDLVTRAEALKMLLAAKGIAPITEDQGFKDLGSDASLNGYINAAAKAGIVNKGTAFNPNNTASRGEAFKIAANSAGLTTTATAETGNDLNLGDLFGDTTATGTTATGTTSTGVTSTGTTTVAAAGDLEVALGAKSPANGSQVASTGIVRFAVVDFTAGGADISVNTVEIKKSGLASIPTGTKVWFEKAGTRLSGKASFTSENNAVISFAPALVVKAGSTESLDLYVELNGAGIGNDMQFASAAITSSAMNTKGSFLTPTLRVTNYSVASSTFTANTSGQSYNAGSDAVELAKFTIQNTDTNPDTRDLKFQSVVLYQSGTANLTNLSNITVEKNGVVVSSAAVVSGKTLALTVSDIVKDGASAIYTVRAQINNVELTTDTYQLYLKNTSDVNIVETDSAFRSNLTSSAMVAGLYSVSGGDVKFERDTTAPLSQTVAPGTSDVTLMKGTITAKSAVNLEDIYLDYTTTVANASVSMNTVYLQIGASTLTATPSASLTGTLQFLGTATVSGTVPVRAYVKLKDAAAGTIKLHSFSIAEVHTRKEYAVNQNTVTSAIGSIDGVTVTIGSSTLNVSRTDGLGATNLASGSKGVTVYGAHFSSTQGNPIALSNFSVTTTGSASNYTGGNTSLTLYVNGVAKSTKNVQSTTVNFDNFNSTISTTTGVDIVIKADFSDVITSGSFGINGISYQAVDNVTSATVTSVSVVGALFTIATPTGTLAATTGDTIVNKTLLLAGSSTQKVASFKVTASNDVIKLKDITLTGANLTALSNIRLTDSVGTVLGTASNVTATGATFANLDNAAGSQIAIDRSATYYVVADVNSSTDQAGVVVNVLVSGSDITGSNGALVAMTGSVVAGASHDVAQNTFKVTLGTPTSKDIATDAMEFTVNAFGKNSVTLSGATFNNILSGYTGSTVLTVVRKSDNAVVGSANATTGVVTFTANNSIDAGTSATYVVKLVGTVVNGSSTSQGWTVSLTNLTTTTGLDAANYPKNTDTFPLTTNK